MKTRFSIQYLIGFILLLTFIIPVAAETSTISGISTSQAYTGTSTGIITVTGTNFNTTLVYVRLMKDGETNITASITSHSSTLIKCKFTILSSASVGSWDLVVVNQDGSEVVDSGAFSIRRTITLTSVSPTYALTNNESAEVTVTGTGLSDIENMYLYNSEYTNISAVIYDLDSTEVVGIFDLTDAEIDTYKICVEDSFGTVKCDLSFNILTDEVGSIDVESSPSGAKVYVDSTYEGTTPCTIEDIEPGSHKLLISKTGYVDYTKWITVKADSTVTISADLNIIATAAQTSAPTVATTKTPLKANTIKVPTPWPASEPTQTSAPGTAVVLGTIALAFVILYRK